MLKYNEDVMSKALGLLNNIEVKGLDNMKRLLLIEQIIQNPEEDKEDGSDSLQS